ncbi:unnamed protein product [Adineta steineri]|uniref:EGF-like domain-containing protein n=1 Tax=Adineta steineri TaxID=433720 RepID=A0A818M5J7_9BILA|nr:unnamed protein product [Adineta steineri]
MLIDFGLSLSYNRPKLCPNAIWNTNATTFTNTPTINGQLIGIFVDSNNTVYFADTSNDRVLVWSGSNGTLIRTITSPLKKPMSVFVTMNGDIYVDTEKNSEIDIYKFNATIGIKKMSVSDSCYGLFIDLNNTLYCSIQNLNTVISQLLDNNGTSASFTYGTGWGGSANELNKPQDVVLDADGYLFIVDSYNNRIVRSEPNGFRCLVGCSGQGTGSDQLDSPQNSTFLSTVLTTDQTGIDSTISSVITTISSSQIYATTPIHTTQIITNSPLTISATSTSSLSNFIVPTCNSSSYIGSACNISSAPCVMLDPCQNAGTCINNNTVLSGYICQCSFGFNGTYCEVDTRPCKANTCWYNGSCSNRSNSNFTCECQEGWEGNQCETMVNYCENITCENGGICQGLFGDYNCECLSASYSGRHCEITANILVARKAISKSVGYIGLLCITGLVSFIIILDILKYGFHIDPIRAERKRMRQKKDQKRRRKPTVVVRFQYIDEATSSHSNVTETIV